MEYSVDVEKAYRFAKRIHASQKDKAGKPYIEHLERVADRVMTPEEKVVAYLHDSIEDTQTDYLTIVKEFGEDTAKSVQRMTHTEGVSYMDYIKAISEDQIARSVKISDLIDNSNLSRLDVVTPEDVARQGKYNKALLYLISC